MTVAAVEAVCAGRGASASFPYTEVVEFSAPVCTVWAPVVGGAAWQPTTRYGAAPGCTTVKMAADAAATPPCKGICIGKRCTCTAVDIVCPVYMVGGAGDGCASDEVFT